VFEYLTRENHVDFKMEPIYAWYSTLYRHKTQYNFYLVHNNFISEFKKLIFVPNTSRPSLEVTTFLSSKGIYETSEEFIVILLFGGEENCLLFSHFMYWIEFSSMKCVDNIKPRPIYFMIEGKNNSLLPWKIGEFIVKHVTYLDELIGHHG
jgi:hypothetical protein